MKIQRWLTINRRGWTKISINHPRLNTDEISILLKLELPDALFEKPSLFADIAIPNEVVRDQQITAEVTDNIEKAIKSVTGLEMRVSVVEPPEED